MPIAREHRWLYPIDWRELSAFIRFGRAKGRCEHCRRPHGRYVLHLGDGVWWDEDAARWRDGQGRGVRRLPAPMELARAQPGFAGIDPPASLRVTRVVLASAHLNHDPGDNRPRSALPAVPYAPRRWRASPAPPAQRLPGARDRRPVRLIDDPLPACLPACLPAGPWAKPQGLGGWKKDAADNDGLHYTCATTELRPPGMCR